VRESVKPAGYIAVLQSRSGDFALASAVHGAISADHIDGALKGPASIEQTAVATFQLMAAGNVSRINATLEDRNDAVVIGSGPVRMGAVFEILRFGFFASHHCSTTERFCCRSL